MLPTGNKLSLLDGKDKDYSMLTQLSNINWELKLFCQLVSFSLSKVPKDG